MKPQIRVTLQNVDRLFYLEQLTNGTALGGFFCPIAEYTDYLFNDALRSQNDHVALSIARACNRQLFAARFLTVDADIEHDEGVLAFYEKNGFIPNAQLNNKNRKTVSMRKDIYS